VFDFAVFPVLETQRLILREITSADAEAIFALRSDAEVTRYNGVPTYMRVEQAHELIESMAQCYRDRRELRWGVTLKGDDKVVGMCGYNYWVRQDYRASIGYDLERTCWGQGIMPEALRAIIQFGFERMALNRIEADASLENVASIRVLHKLGFQREGLQRQQYFENGEFHDLVLFSLLKSDYYPS
jgi:ribosomal-protein-alanine N-acetyltransferase